MGNQTKLPIAAWVLCNTASLNVWEFSNCNEGMLVGVNNDVPEWCEIEYMSPEEIDADLLEENSLIACIRFNGTWNRLDECIKLGGE